jgi:hypothetical protein
MIKNKIFSALVQEKVKKYANAAAICGKFLEPYFGNQMLS